MKRKSRLQNFIAKLLGSSISRVKLYESINGAMERREVIRRFMLNEPEDLNNDIRIIIGLALHDNDWEVRVSAMLACVYFGLNEQYGAIVQELKLPETSDSGLDKRERAMVADFKREAINLLNGYTIPEEPENLDSPENYTLYVRRLVGFKTIGKLTDIRLLFFSLMAPYYYTENKDRIHSAIVKKSNKYYLGDIELIRLPNIKAFLGGEAKNMNEFIFAHIPRNMFVSKNIIPASKLIEIEGYIKEDMDKVNYDVSDAFCKYLSEKHNIVVQIPDQYLWEYTVRGYNGRKYPWGNSIEKGQPNIAHPYGIENYIGHGGEWTKTLVNDKYRILMGADPDLRAGRVQYATENFKANLRIAVYGDGN